MSLPVYYFPGALVPILFFPVLAIMVPKVLDAGQTEASFQMASAAYAVLITPVLLRRLRKPTRTDVSLITWGLPILFFLAMYLIRFAPDLPRLSPERIF